MYQVIFEVLGKYNAVVFDDSEQVKLFTAWLHGFYEVRRKESYMWVIDQELSLCVY